MCLAIPGKIKQKKGKYALVDFDGATKKIKIVLTPKVKKNDYVLVHAGFAIEKLRPSHAQSILCLNQEIKQLAKH